MVDSSWSDSMKLRDKEREDQESIQTQMLMIKDMKDKGQGTFCMVDKTDGTPLTYGDLFDRHARMMLVIKDVEERLEREEKALNNPEIGVESISGATHEQ